MSSATVVKTEVNLQHRLLKITAEVAVRATGKTAQGQRTMSIADVETSLADLCAKHGVVMGDYTWNAEPKVVAQQGNVTLWQADLNLLTVNADNPEDRIHTRLVDVGTSPSAAVSFALKRYYRALFHLADEEDERRSTPLPKERVRQEEVVPQGAIDQGTSQGGGMETVATPSQGGLALLPQQKALLASLAHSLDIKLTPKEVREAGGYFPVRDRLIALHLEKHGACGHWQEAVQASSAAGWDPDVA